MESFICINCGEIVDERQDCNCIRKKVAAQDLVMHPTSEWWE